MKNKLLEYQQNCFNSYIESIGIEQPYVFPDGNSIRPLPPIHTKKGGVMIIGAYPSARFERRKNKSNQYRFIPVGNNLHPFADEVYFNGLNVYRLESGHTIRKFLLDPLGLKLEECWITDLVKVFLYKKKHRDAINDIYPDINISVNRDYFLAYGRGSIGWIKEEIKICNPMIILTLGEEVAKVILDSSLTADDLLIPDINNPSNLLSCNTMCLPHPDSCRRSEKWRNIIKNQIRVIKDYL